MEQNVYKRLARTEAMANLQKSQLVEVLQNAYNAACLAKDEQAAADAARALQISWQYVPPVSSHKDRIDRKREVIAWH